MAESGGGGGNRWKSVVKAFVQFLRRGSQVFNRLAADCVVIPVCLVVPFFFTRLSSDSVQSTDRMI